MNSGYVIWRDLPPRYDPKRVVFMVEAMGGIYKRFEQGQRVFYSIKAKYLSPPTNLTSSAFIRSAHPALTVLEPATGAVVTNSGASRQPMCVLRWDDLLLNIIE